MAKKRNNNNRVKPDAAEKKENLVVDVENVKKSETKTVLEEKVKIQDDLSEIDEDEFLDSEFDVTLEKRDHIKIIGIAVTFTLMLYIFSFFV